VHTQGIIHSDIKLENILHTTSDVAEELPIAKLCDFGLSHKTNNDGKATALLKCGTMGYMAPELKQTLEITPNLDMWSFGVVLYEMATAYKPTAVKNYEYGSGKIPFVSRDWRKRNKHLQDLIE
jgi:serine/threonine protein kinase